MVGPLPLFPRFRRFPLFPRFRRASGLVPSGVALLGVALLGGALAQAVPPRLNGFALHPSAIPADEIRPGGPPPDGIPALDRPAVVGAGAALLDADDMVVGVVVGGEARAYPLAILTWHELVNDELGGTPLLVSFCPLCGTALVFDRRLDGRARRFGVSGLLYQSDLLMFDRETGSLWSQITARAETGALMGRRLALVRSRIERWGRWKASHPSTTVLSRDTGHRRDYDRSPYPGYAESPDLSFPVRRQDPRYHPKMPVLGLRTADGRARAYPAVELRRAGGRAEERFAGRRVRIRYDLDAKVFQVEAPAAIEVVEGYWFAWVAFHPETEVFVAPGDP
ncbi:MAG: DUF3179 domain-containing protein [Myxococcota bacterium]